MYSAQRSSEHGSTVRRNRLLPDCSPSINQAQNDTGSCRDKDDNCTARTSRARRGIPEGGWQEPGTMNGTRDRCCFNMLPDSRIAASSSPVPGLNNASAGSWARGTCCAAPQRCQT
jgi:hypothetical protein